jgi:hypothetical protein
MQQRSCDGNRPDTKICEYLRHRQGVSDVGLTTVPGLAFVSFLSYPVGPLQERNISLRVVLSNRFVQNF